MSSAIKFDSFINLGEGFAYGKSVHSVFKPYNRTSDEFTSQVSETFNFTQKIENMEDFLHLSSTVFDFEGFNQGRSHVPFSSNGDFSVSFVAGYSVLGSTTVIDQGLETLILTDPAKFILDRNYPRFLDFFGFHAYDSFTSGWLGICRYDIVAKGFKEAEVIRGALENVTTDIFYDEKKYDELEDILSHLDPLSFSADCDCALFTGIVPPSLECSSDVGARLEKMLDIPFSALNPSPFRATVSPYSNSSDFQSEFEKLSADDAARFYNDARVNFTLTEEVARILSEDNAKSKYILDSSRAFLARHHCHLMNDIPNEAIRNMIMHDLNKATALRALSSQIIEGNYAGDGSKLVEKYYQVVEQCIINLSTYTNTN